MTPRIDVGALAKVHAWEYLARFAFGGAVTACTGLIAHSYGPEIGGLFLAFPAILPASLTLVKRHDGRRCAADDAHGAQVGAAALIVFAALAWAMAMHHSPVTTLAVATVTWAAVAIVLWTFIYGRPHPLR